MSTLSAAPPAPGAGTTATGTVALIGPPNTGKSTLFNVLTGLRQKVANYPGVTVEQHTGTLRLDQGQTYTLVDLPGVHSLDPRSEDEQVTHDVLSGQMPGTPKPSAVLLIFDATNLPRHLMLAAPVLDLGIPTLIILNMADDLAGRGGTIDPAQLAREVGAPVVLLSAAKNQGVDQVRDWLARTIPAPARIELPVLNNLSACRKWSGEVADRAGYTRPSPPLWTYRLDRFLLHPILGPLTFILVVLAVFQSIFTLAQPLMDALEGGIQASGKFLEAQFPPSIWRDLIFDGAWNGVGSVLVFLPQILILFAFIAFLEDSGYLARAALIADRAMASVGLQGKSFIPLLSGYACAIPAILSARTIENKRDRFATILVAPLMTCSARLPVYTLLIAAFIPDKPLLGPFLGWRAATMLLLYVIGFLAAFLTARLLKSTIFRSEKTPFMLELPPYRWPRPRTIALRLLERAMLFLRRAATIILFTAILLWVLANLPRTGGQAPPIAESYAGQIGKAMEPAIVPLGFNWRIGIGLLTSLAAREVIVGTLGTIYGIEASDEDTGGLQEVLRKDLTLPGAVSLMVFFAFALQCMSTIAVVRRETGNWRWPAVQFLYMGAVAYVSSWVVFQTLTRLMS